jgi:small subunit ribosomal protein S17e
MGRIKTRFEKSNAQKIYKTGTEEFGEDFDKNKVATKKIANIPSKRLRNKIVGYITRLSKRAEE